MPYVDRFSQPRHRYVSEQRSSGSSSVTPEGRSSTGASGFAVEREREVTYKFG